MLPGQHILSIESVQKHAEDSYLMTISFIQALHRDATKVKLADFSSLSKPFKSYREAKSNCSNFRPL